MLRGMSLLAVGIVIATSLSGCLITRVQTVQSQACEFDKNFEISFDNGMTITFMEPVLLFEDVTFIAGIAPDFQYQSGNHYTMSYTLKQIGNPDTNNIPINFEFRTQGGELLLTKISAHSPLLAFFNPAQLPQLTESACTTEIPLWQTRIEIPIADFDRSDIPTRQQILELAGPPTLLSSDGTELEYQFELVGADDNGITGSLNLKYDRTGSILKQTRTQFYHYVVGADFEIGSAWGTVTL